MSYEVPGLDWSDGRMLPAFQTMQHLDIYDIRGSSPDTQLAVTTLAGLLNRPCPRVYLFASGEDAYWLQQLRGPLPDIYTQSADHPSGDAALNALLDAYQTSVQGLIIYDPNLIDTVNVATTLAGQRDGIVVAPELAQRLQDLYKLPVLADLRSYHWRSRMQAYQWAQQNLLAGCTARMVAGLGPNNMSGLRSFLVATRTFVYWLDSRQYLPDLSAGLLTERALIQQIYGQFSPGAVHLGWFIDESSGVHLTSQAALPVLASDACTNLEVWTALPAVATISQPRTSAPSPIENKIYLSFTISDGDNIQYCQHRMLTLWRDSARGSLPIGWTISPALLQAAPALATYYQNSATANDELIAGPSGAGYMFPSHWPAAHLPSFLQRTGQLMQAMGLTTLEVLDTAFWESLGLPLVSNIRLTGMAFTDSTAQQSFVQALTPYGLRGILSGSGLATPRWQGVQGVPLYHNLGLATTVEQTVGQIKSAASASTQRPLFLNAYIMAWSMTPSQLKQVVQQLGPGYEIVLPRQLLTMLNL